jgi:hypothetical protein
MLPPAKLQLNCNRFLAYVATNPSESGQAAVGEVDELGCSENTVLRTKSLLARLQGERERWDDVVDSAR